MVSLHQKLHVANRAVQYSFNTDAHTFTCILNLSHSAATDTQTPADLFCFYTQESGEPVNLFALFEGLRVVE